jgi:hypothetical protein
VREVEAQEREVGLVIARDIRVDLAVGVVVVVAILAMGRARAMVQALALVEVRMIPHEHKLISFCSI